MQAITAAEEASTTKYDLKAQQEMAIWALGVLLATIASVVTTIIGILFVALNLREARIVSANSQAANEIFERSHRAENPPRFHIKQIRLDLEEWIDPSKRSGELWIFNTGLSKLQMRTSCIVFHTGKHPPPTNPWEVNRIANRLRIYGKTVVKDDVFDLREGCWWPFVGDGCTVAPDRIKDALTGTGGMRFFVMGRIHYWDIDKTHRHVVFCLAYDPNSKRFVTLDDTDYEYQT